MRQNAQHSTARDDFRLRSRPATDASIHAVYMMLYFLASICGILEAPMKSCCRCARASVNVHATNFRATLALLRQIIMTRQRTHEPCQVHTDAHRRHRIACTIRLSVPIVWCVCISLVYVCVSLDCMRFMTEMSACGLRACFSRSGDTTKCVITQIKHMRKLNRPYDVVLKWNHFSLFLAIFL